MLELRLEVSTLVTVDTMHVSSRQPVDYRLQVVAKSDRLFAAAKSGESTAIDQIAERQGVAADAVPAVRSKRS